MQGVRGAGIGWCLLLPSTCLVVDSGHRALHHCLPSSMPRGGCSILRPSVRLCLLSYAMLFVSTKPSGTCIIACLHCICIAQSSYSTVKRSIKLCQACERRARACVSCRLRLRLQPRACLDMCVGWGGLLYYRGLRGLGWFSLRSKTRS